MKLTPNIFGRSLWWNGWRRMAWGRSENYSFGIGPMSLEKGYIG